MTPGYYITIEKESVAEFKDRGSRFIAFAFPVTTVDDFKSRLQQIKEAHPKAVHHCFAYRLGTDGNNFRVNDDGEPSGTAGRPILGQIDSRGLTNITLIVVRYFGGVLLGVGGLIHAYKSAASAALSNNTHVTKAIEINYRLRFNYDLMNEIMRLVKKFNCTILRQDLQLSCIMELGIPLADSELFLKRLIELHGVEWEKS